MINDQTACHLVETAADAVLADRDGFHAILDELPAAIYVTDSEGTITYFNQGCGSSRVARRRSVPTNGA